MRTKQEIEQEMEEAEKLFEYHDRNAAYYAERKADLTREWEIVDEQENK